MIGTFVGNMETSRESCYVFDGVYQIWFVVKNILSFNLHVPFSHLLYTSSWTSNDNIVLYWGIGDTKNG